jgi:hypothetical protein
MLYINTDDVKMHYTAFYTKQHDARQEHTLTALLCTSVHISSEGSAFRVAR